MTIGDKILIIFILILSVAGLIFISYAGIDSGQKYVIIKVDDELVKKISVSGAEKNKIYSFDFGEGNKGYIEVNKGEVRMIEMDKKVCPQGICSDTGWISTRYQNIVCLPNKLYVGFEQKMNEDLDIISY